MDLLAFGTVVRSAEQRTDAVMSGAQYAVDPCPLGWVIRVLSPNGGSATIDYMRTPGAARWAARELAEGHAHVEPHQPLGSRVQPGPAR